MLISKVTEIVTDLVIIIVIITDIGEVHSLLFNDENIIKLEELINVSVIYVS